MVQRKYKMADSGHVCRRPGFFFGTCTTRHSGEHSDQVTNTLARWSWKRCGNCYKPARNQPAKFVEQSEHYRHLGEHSDQVSKENPPSGLGGDAITRNVYRLTDRWTDGRTPTRPPSTPRRANDELG